MEYTVIVSTISYVVGRGMGGNSDKNKNHTEVGFRSHNDTRECIREDKLGLLMIISVLNVK